MSKLDDRGVSKIDPFPVRGWLASRVESGRRDVLAFLVWIPLVMSVCAFAAWVGLEDSSAAKAWRAAGLVAGGTAVTYIAVGIWWWRFRDRSARAIAGGDDASRRWLGVLERSDRRGAVLDGAAWIALVLLVVWIVVTRVSAGSGLFGALVTAGVVLVLLHVGAWLLEWLRSR